MLFCAAPQSQYFCSKLYWQPWTTGCHTKTTPSDFNLSEIPYLLLRSISNSEWPTGLMYRKEEQEQITWVHFHCLYKHTICSPRLQKNRKEKKEAKCLLSYETLKWNGMFYFLLSGHHMYWWASSCTFQSRWSCG